MDSKKITGSEDIKPRILLIDIETAPNLVYSFDLRNAFIGIEQIVEPSRMLCFGAKWYGEPKVEFRSEFHHGREAMVLKAHSLLTEADVLLHFNGKKFDEPKINVEFYRDGLMPPAPYQRIDLWAAAVKRFSFPSSRLNHILRESDLPGKVETGGFSLWKDCLDGDPKAWARMRKYNIQDVKAMEPLYERMRPWIPNHPSMGSYNGTSVCPDCGSDQLEKRGFAYTQVGKYQRYLCSCGRWSQDTKRVAGTGIKAVA